MRLPGVAKISLPAAPHLFHLARRLEQRAAVRAYALEKERVVALPAIAGAHLSGHASAAMRMRGCLEARGENARGHATDRLRSNGVWAAGAALRKGREAHLSLGRGAMMAASSSVSRSMSDMAFQFVASGP